jgi:hypothetical protein
MSVNRTLYVPGISLAGPKKELSTRIGHKPTAVISSDSRQSACRRNCHRPGSKARYLRPFDYSDVELPTGRNTVKTTHVLNCIAAAFVDVPAYASATGTTTAGAKKRFRRCQP